MKIGTQSKILFVQNGTLQCGVADYGRRLFDIIKPHLNIELREVNNLEDYYDAINIANPDIVLYNYHYATLPFIKDEILNKGIKHYAIFHEASLNFTPDKVIDTSIRPLVENIKEISVYNKFPCIGTFGFGFADKNFSRVAELVLNEFDEAIVRLVIPFAYFGDRDGVLAKKEADKIRSILSSSKIHLELHHTHLSPKDLIHFLQGNDINLFLYNRSYGRGLSSAIDYALSARRPIGVSDSEMFRHCPKEICIDSTTIKELISKGVKPLKEMYETHSNDNLIKRFKGWLQ